MVKERLLTISQLAELLGISRIAVYKRVKKGQIAARKLGRSYVISDRDITEVLGKKMTVRGRQSVKRAVSKAARDYGDVLKWLGKD